MTGSRAIAITALLLALIDPALAQQPRDGARGQPSGTGIVSGIVQTTGSPSAPIRRAVVTLSGPPLVASRTAITDDAGRFTIGGLPAGHFVVNVSKPAFLTTAYGATRMGRTGTTIALAGGERADIAIPLPRGAVVTGTIRNEQGEPTAGAAVRLMDLHSPTFAPPAGVDVATADDRGMYRIYGAPPGDYMVAATARQLGSGDIGRRSNAEMDALLGDLAGRASRAAPGQQPAPIPERRPQSTSYAPTYFPGVASAANAARLRLAAGEERAGVDFPVLIVPVATVEGVVTDGTGQSIGNVQLSMLGEGPRVPAATPQMTGSGPVLNQRPGADGRFVYSNVPPGRYTITARGSAGPAAPPTPATVTMLTVTPPPSSSSADFSYAQAVIDVDGQDITGVALQLQPGTVFSGRVVFDGAPSSRRPDMTTIRVGLLTPGPTFYTISNGTLTGNALTVVPPVSVQRDGTFVVRGIAPGTYTLRATLPSGADDTWTIDTAVSGTRDLLDGPVRVNVGDRLADAVLTFSDRRTEISGTLQTAAGRPAPEYVIIAIPADPAQWQPGSRRLQLARPDTRGHFSIQDLPAGDYLLAALTDLDPNELDDRQFLDDVAGLGVRVTLAAGGHTVQNLGITETR